jgi:hypothetical protein
MNFAEFFTAANGNITGGAPYEWNAFGPDAHFVEFGPNGEVQCIVDRKSTIIYAVEIFDEENNSASRWINPEFKHAFLAECVKHSVDPDEAYDGVLYEDISYHEALMRANVITASSQE